MPEMCIGMQRLRGKGVARRANFPLPHHVAATQTTSSEFGRSEARPHARRSGRTRGLRARESDPLPLPLSPGLGNVVLRRQRGC
eukprot:scaffold129196_cov69-Phaeocystis_antarctica.AAC.2